MQDVTTMLKTLKRPGLLMRAARLGAEEYRRSVHMPRLVGYGTLPRHNAALLQLMEIEATLDAQRRSEDSAYSLLRHIDVLIAIVGEARIMRAAQSAAA